MNLVFRIFSVILLLNTTLFAQDFLGFSNSNYAGVTGIDLQPSSIVDSRYKVDINLIGGSLFGYNNYVGMYPDALQEKNVLKDPFFRENYLVLKDNYDKAKSIFLRGRLDFPSALITISETEAIAFNFRRRSYLNIDGIETPLARLAFQELNYPTLFSTAPFSNKFLSMQGMTWNEYAFSYGRVLFNKNKHFLKAGIRFKALQGQNAGYVYIKDLQYNFINDTTVSFINTNVSYGSSQKSSWGLGLDLGATYEYRPKWKKYVYEMDGDTNLVRRDKNKYLWKVGFSILDIGGINFDKGSNSGDFTADINQWNIQQIRNLDWTINDVRDFKVSDNLDTTLRKTFAYKQSQSNFYMNLPTAISLQFDYNIYQDFYVNLTPYFALKLKNNQNKLNELTTVALTPRWDHKWFGVFLPVSYNSMAGMNMGISLRLGPVVIGTTDLLPVIGTRKIYGGDFHVMFKLPILYNKTKDRDNDRVSDKNDKCVEMPGVWEFKGCPDCDRDHVPDALDECPDQAGTIELFGCPDTDGDKIIDKLDSCIDVAGLKEFSGCPDTDGDKVIDKLDSCRDVAGLPQLNGCPDKDGDGIIDKIDMCPDLKGPASKKGCPDTDEDGVTDDIDLCPTMVGKKENKGCPDFDKDGDTVLDKDDKCPDVPGAKENKGCPYADVDKDGVFDKDDQCPETAGSIANKGCPEIAKEEQEIINTAFSALEFETGKDVIKNESYASLIELSKLLIKKQEWTLLLAGHTDNQGAPAKNKLLSEKRSKAVKKFLVDNGVKAERIKAEWYGQTKPIAPNTTPEGRQKNRRVEMNVLFK